MDVNVRKVFPSCRRHTVHFQRRKKKKPLRKPQCRLLSALLRHDTPRPVGKACAALTLPTGVSGISAVHLPYQGSTSQWASSAAYSLTTAASEFLQVKKLLKTWILGCECCRTTGAEQQFRKGDKKRGKTKVGVCTHETGLKFTAPVV